MPELQASGRQVAALGRGRGRGGRGRGNDRGRGRGRGGRGRGPNPNPTNVTKCAELVPDQPAVDRVKASIAHRYITQNRIFVNEDQYNALTKAERQAVFQIRKDLSDKLDPLAGLGRARHSDLAAMHRSVQELSSRMDSHYGPAQHEDEFHQHGPPDAESSRSNKNQPGLVRQAPTRRSNP